MPINASIVTAKRVIKVNGTVTGVGTRGAGAGRFVEFIQSRCGRVGTYHRDDSARLGCVKLELGSDRRAGRGDYRHRHRLADRSSRISESRVAGMGVDFTARHAGLRDGLSTHRRAEICRAGAICAPRLVLVARQDRLLVS